MTALFRGERWAKKEAKLATEAEAELQAVQDIYHAWKSDLLAAIDPADRDLFDALETQLTDGLQKIDDTNQEGKSKLYLDVMKIASRIAGAPAVPINPKLQPVHSYMGDIHVRIQIPSKLQTKAEQARTRKNDTNKKKSSASTTPQPRPTPTGAASTPATSPTSSGPLPSTTPTSASTHEPTPTHVEKSPREILLHGSVEEIIERFFSSQDSNFSDERKRQILENNLRSEDLKKCAEALKMMCQNYGAAQVMQLADSLRDRCAQIIQTLSYISLLSSEENSDWAYIGLAEHYYFSQTPQGKSEKRNYDIEILEEPITHREVQDRIIATHLAFDVCDAFEHSSNDFLDRLKKQNGSPLDTATKDKIKEVFSRYDTTQSIPRNVMVQLGFDIIADVFDTSIPPRATTSDTSPTASKEDPTVVSASKKTAQEIRASLDALRSGGHTQEVGTGQETRDAEIAFLSTQLDTLTTLPADIPTVLKNTEFLTQKKQELGDAVARLRKSLDALPIDEQRDDAIEALQSEIDQLRTMIAAYFTSTQYLEDLKVAVQEEDFLDIHPHATAYIKALERTLNGNSLPPAEPAPEPVPITVPTNEPAAAKNTEIPAAELHSLDDRIDELTVLPTNIPQAILELQLLKDIKNKLHTTAENYRTAVSTLTTVEDLNELRERIARETTENHNYFSSQTFYDELQQAIADDEFFVVDDASREYLDSLKERLGIAEPIETPEETKDVAEPEQTVPVVSPEVQDTDTPLPERIVLNEAKNLILDTRKPVIFSWQEASCLANIVAFDPNNDEAMLTLQIVEVYDATDTVPAGSQQITLTKADMNELTESRTNWNAAFIQV